MSPVAKELNVASRCQLYFVRILPHLFICSDDTPTEDIERLSYCHREGSFSSLLHVTRFLRLVTGLPLTRLRASMQNLDTEPS